MIGCPGINTALGGDVLALWKAGRDQALSQSEDHGTQGIGCLLGVAVSVELLQETAAVDALTSAVNEKHQKMQCLAAEALSQHHRLSLIGHTETTQHLDVDYILITRVLLFDIVRSFFRYFFICLF